MPPLLCNADAVNDLDLRIRLELERPERRSDPDTLLAESSFRAFVNQAWHVVEPASPLVPGLHIDAIADHMQAVADGRIRRLLITVPPRHGKSSLISVLWPAWIWATRPHLRFLCASYAGSLAIRDNVRCRRLIGSWWYQKRWGHRVHLTDDQNQKVKFENDAGGYRIATSVGGTATGDGGWAILVDDAHNVVDAESDAIRQTALDWFDQSMSTRTDDPDVGVHIVVGQRVHEQDLAGHVLEQGGYVHLNLPAEYEPKTTVPVSPIGWSDPRTEPGELLWPVRFDRAALEDLKLRLGSRAASAQLQQEPAPLGGDILKREWWKLYYRLPDVFDELWQSWDCAFKDTADSDYVVGQVWGRLGDYAFLVDQVRARMSFVETLAAVERVTALWPLAYQKLIEDKANGTAVLNALAATVGGLLAVEPEGGKITRAYAVSPFIESGHVLIPHPSIAPWATGFLDECARFPRGAYDDQVDAMTQALTRMLVWRQSISRHQTPDGGLVKVTGGLQG